MQALRMARRASMLVLFFTVFIDLIGFGIVIPLLPFFAKHFGVSSLMVAALSSVFSLMQFIFAPYWGRLSDRVGRRPVLIISLAGSTLSYLALVFCSSFSHIFLARMFAGIFGGNIAVANAYIADITTPEKRSQGMGLIGAAFGLGFVLGPAIGFSIAYFAEDPANPERVYRMIGLVAAVVCGLNFFLALWNLPESYTPSTNQPARQRGAWEAWKSVFRNRLVGFLVTLYFVLGFSFSNFENFFPLLIAQKFSFGVKEGSFLFTFLGLVVAAVQGGLIGKLVDKFGERTLILSGGLIFSAGFFALPWVYTMGMILWTLIGLGLGQGLNRSSILGLISRSISSDEQGAILGVTQSIGSLARIVGPLAGGLIFDKVGSSPLFLMIGFLIIFTLLLGLPLLLKSQVEVL